MSVQGANGSAAQVTFNSAQPGIGFGVTGIGQTSISGNISANGAVITRGGVTNTNAPETTAAAPVATPEPQPAQVNSTPQVETPAAQVAQVRKVPPAGRQGQNGGHDGASLAVANSAETISKVTRAYALDQGLDPERFAQVMNAVFHIECDGVQNCVNTSYVSEKLYEGSFQLSRQQYADNLAEARTRAQALNQKGLLSNTDYQEFTQAVAAAQNLPDGRYSHITNTWAAVNMHAKNEGVLQRLYKDNVIMHAAFRQAQQLQPNPTNEVLASGDLSIKHRFTPSQMATNRMVGTVTMQDVVTRIASPDSGYGRKIREGVSRMRAYEKLAYQGSLLSE